jgi:hypothetical protein
MKFMELVALLDKTIVELNRQCPEGKFVLIGSEGTSTCFRGTQMTEQECADALSKTLTLVVFQKTRFVTAEVER